MSSDARNIHMQSIQAREEGDFFHSLRLNDEAIMAYSKERDQEGLSEAISNRSITLRLLAQKEGGPDFLVLAKYEMMAAVEIAQGSGQEEALALPLYNLAKILEDLEDFQSAVNTYKQAVEKMQNHPPKRHNRPAVIADMRLHLFTCEYKAGEKDAMFQAEEALRELEVADESDRFSKDVWVSGGYMRLADMLKTDNHEKAKEYLQKAREIIYSNSDLVLRRNQWEKLAKSISS